MYYTVCTGKHHSSVAVLSLVPAALVTIRQQTRDISLYTLYNILLLELSGAGLRTVGERGGSS